MRSKKFASAAVACVLSVAMAQGLFAAERLALPFDDTCIVKGGDVSAEFAVRELNFVVSNATGKTFREFGGRGASHRIFVGRSPEAEAILGRGFFDGLKDEESVVTAKGGDLFLVGGGQIGCLYAVYDFVEDNLNFRHYFWKDDGFVVDNVQEVVFSGAETRRIPKFRGQRIDHHVVAQEAIYEVRNRANCTNAERLMKGYRHKFTNRFPGHGFHPGYIPRDDPPKYWVRWAKSPITNGYFKVHPEWFTLNKEGKRVADAQICLSNPELRQELYNNLVKWIRVHGTGFYMVGSNDDQGDRYCWCEGCLALERKYNSVGGPLWDWMLWACPKLEADGYKDVYIKTLAYKGPQQTERAPSGIEKFPSNFVCDAAFLNGDRPLKDVPDIKLEDGTVFNRLKNLDRWCQMCDHVSYWYYGGSNPGQVYRRATEELRELDRAGVESVGACGIGGGYEFRDFTPWIYFRLLRDPYCDLEPDLRRILAIKYGPAAAKAREYIDALDAMVKAETMRRAEVTSWDDIYERFTFLSGEQLFALRRIADEALALAKGTPYEMHVKYMRFGINVWTIRMLAKMKAQDRAAAEKIDVAALDAEVREAEPAWLDEYYPVGKTMRDHFQKTIHRPSLQLDEMANYMNLKTEELPDEIKAYPADKVNRILPPKKKRKHPRYGGGWSSMEDPDAIAGFAWYEGDPGSKLKTSPASTGTFKIECYDSVSRKWLANQLFPTSMFKPGKYTMVKVGRMPLPDGFWMVFGSLWSSDVGIKEPGRLYDSTYPNKEYDIWVSIKCQGPWFFKDAPADAKSSISVDQVFCVDMGVPEGK